MYKTTIILTLGFLMSCSNKDNNVVKESNINKDSIIQAEDTLTIPTVAEPISQNNTNCTGMSYVEGWEIGQTVRELSSSETCDDIKMQMKNDKDYSNYVADECFCIGFNDSKNGINKDKYQNIKNNSDDSKNINTQNQYTIEEIREMSGNYDTPAKSNTSNLITYTYYDVMGSIENPAFFHDAPDYAHRRKGRFTTRETVFVQQIVNGFAYVEFTNSGNKTSKGWIEVTYLRY